MSEPVSSALFYMVSLGGESSSKYNGHSLAAVSNRFHDSEFVE